MKSSSVALLLAAITSVATATKTCDSVESCVADPKAMVPVSPNVPQLDPGAHGAQIVRPEHASSNPLGVSNNEWKDRAQLAATYRAMHLYGMGDDLAAQCLMLRTTDDPSQFLLHGTSHFAADRPADLTFLRCQPRHVSFLHQNGAFFSKKSLRPTSSNTISRAISCTLTAAKRWQHL